MQRIAALVTAACTAAGGRRREGRVLVCVEKGGSGGRAAKRERSYVLPACFQVMQPCRSDKLTGGTLYSMVPP